MNIIKYPIFMTCLILTFAGCGSTSVSKKHHLLENDPTKPHGNLIFIAKQFKDDKGTVYIKFDDEMLAHLKSNTYFEVHLIPKKYDISITSSVPRKALLAIGVLRTKELYELEVLPDQYSFMIFEPDTDEQGAYRKFKTYWVEADEAIDIINKGNIIKFGETPVLDAVMKELSTNQE